MILAVVNISKRIAVVLLIWYDPHPPPPLPHHVKGMWLERRAGLPIRSSFLDWAELVFAVNGCAEWGNGPTLWLSAPVYFSCSLVQNCSVLVLYCTGQQYSLFGFGANNQVCILRLPHYEGCTTLNTCCFRWLRFDVWASLSLLSCLASPSFKPAFSSPL